MDTLTSSPPAILYKYLPPERIDVLENTEIRFSRPSEFNDEFDSHFLVPRDQGRSAVAARLRLKARLGIFCLAERADNHLMWVTYARSHTGLVLGFDATDSFFKADGRVLRKVHYRQRPRVIVEPNIEACFNKPDAWTYEGEWRCVRKFEPSESRAVTFEPALIKEVIFGWRMEDWQIARFMVFATAYKLLAHASFFRSAPSHSDWTFQNKPKRVTVCDGCGGAGHLMEDLATE